MRLNGRKILPRERQGQLRVHPTLLSCCDSDFDIEWLRTAPEARLHSAFKLAQEIRAKIPEIDAR
jgi:hypothetical protein